MLRAICEAQTINERRDNDFMLLLGLNETIHQLVMENSTHWHEHVLRREDGHILIRELQIEVKDTRRKGSQKRLGRRHEGWFD